MFVREAHAIQTVREGGVFASSLLTDMTEACSSTGAPAAGQGVVEIVMAEMRRAIVGGD